MSQPANTTVVKEQNAAPAPATANTTVVKEGGAANGGAANASASDQAGGNTTVVKEGGAANQAGAGAAPAGATGATGGTTTAAGQPGTTVVQNEKHAASGASPPTGRKKFLLFGPRRTARNDLEQNRDTNPKLVRNMTRGRLCRLITGTLLGAFLLSLLWGLIMTALGVGFLGAAKAMDEILGRMTDLRMSRAQLDQAGTGFTWDSYVETWCNETSKEVSVIDQRECYCNFYAGVCDSVDYPIVPQDVGACEWLEEFDLSQCPVREVPLLEVPPLEVTTNSSIAASTTTPFFTTFTTTNYAATVTVPSTTRVFTTLMSMSVTTSTAWFDLPTVTSYATPTVTPELMM
ncbi:hypothetical protein MBLNU230_g1627t1 [Neophaeotheca triangularis]